MHFEAHGNIDFFVGDSCVINRPNESFNQEGVKLLFETFFKRLKTKKITSWMLFEFLGGNAFPTPDAMAELTSCYKSSRELGCVKVAAVCGTTAQCIFLEQVAEKANMAISFYSTEEEALTANQDFLPANFSISDLSWLKGVKSPEG